MDGDKGQVMKSYVFNIEAYRFDTSHLPMIEHGILRSLLDWYYEKEQPVPSSVDLIMRRLRLSSNEQHHLENVLNEYFVLNENGYSNKYADRVLKLYREKCQANRLNGKQGGRPKKSDVVIDENQEESTRINVKRMVPCPAIEIVSLYHDVLPELNQCLILNDQRRKYIQARWRELVDSKEFETEEEGLAFFRKYFESVKRSAFLMGKTGAINGRVPFQADLEWLVRPTNFAKVIEGKYK